MAKGRATPSGRDVVAYFAGHLANLVNGNDELADDVPNVEIRAFQLYDRVTRTLTGNRGYADILVGVWAYPPPADVVAAAEFYFDAVLDRPIGRRAGEPSSADNLRALIARRALGPAPVPDGSPLSTWSALVKGPIRIRRFQGKPELYELSNRILKCLDAANRPYAEVLRLGLSPRDWLTGDDAIALNTLKAANTFLKSLKAAMGGEVGRRPRPGELASAWSAASVPGFAVAEAFCASPLGAAILSRLAGQDHVLLVAFDETDGLGGTVGDDDEELMSPEETQPILERAVAEGAIAPEERKLFAAVLAGEPLAQAVRSDLGLRRRLRGFGDDMSAYVDDLSARIAVFVRRAAAPASP